MIRFKHFVLLALPLLLFSCNPVGINNDPVCAVAYGETLYQSDVQWLIKDYSSREDSLRQAEALISDWVKTQIKLHQAEKYLTPDSHEIEQQIEEYRNSLIIYKYEQILIAEKLDTAISDEEIEDYYQQYMNEFRLEDDVVRGFYVVVPENSHQFYRFKRWLKNYQPDLKEDIDEYCREFAEVYNDFSEEWVFWYRLKSGIQHEIDNEQRLIERQGLQQWNENGKIFLLKITESKLKGDVAPLSIAKNTIRSILLNKRKIRLLKELEESAYQEALNSNQVKLLSRTND